MSKPPTIAGVRWFPTNKLHRDLTMGSEWGRGQQLFITFEVKDTGRGLEQQEMTKLFNRFQQGTAKTHIKYGGSGLGLFISRELTETQGGEIGVLSEPGKGSTFAFYVKGRRAERPEEAPRIARTPMPHRNIPRMVRLASEQAGQPEDNVSNSSRFSVLMVGDNVINAKVLTKQLERAGCDVHVANHGMEALDFLSKCKAWKDSQYEEDAIHFDCILMDIEMPIMDGLTCTRVRQLEEEGLLLRRINIIAITANARQEHIDATLKAGADEVLLKPFKVHELLDKMESILAS
jgi:CheY-like chemotaxis protein